MPTTIRTRDGDLLSTTEWLVGFPDAWAQEVQAAMRAEAPEGFRILFFDPAAPGHVEEIIGTSDYLVTGVFRVTGAVLEAAKKVRLVQRWGAGTDQVDLETARRLGVKVAITAGANAHVVAEHAVLLILAVQRRLLIADKGIRQGEWGPINEGMRAKAQHLAGKTVGIVGFGHIGRAVAKRLKGFDVEIVYSDVRRADPSVEAELGATFVTLDELLRTADVITIHSGGGTGSAHLVDAEGIATMKPNAVLVNAARGTIVDEQALADALREGRIFGAGMDVFPVEPISADDPLIPLENTVLTPHTAASTIDNVSHVARHVFSNILAESKGRRVSPADEIVWF